MFDKLLVPAVVLGGLLRVAIVGLDQRLVRLPFVLDEQQGVGSSGDAGDGEIRHRGRNRYSERSDAFRGGRCDDAAA